MNEDTGVEALRRLVRIAKGDTGQSGRVANFLLAWWNARVQGGFDLVDLWMLDSAIVDDMIKVLSLIANSHSYPDQLGLGLDFHSIISEWRHSTKHRTTIRHAVELFEGSGLTCRLAPAPKSQGIILTCREPHAVSCRERFVGRRRRRRHRPSRQRVPGKEGQRILRAHERALRRDHGESRLIEFRFSGRLRPSRSVSDVIAYRPLGKRRSLVYVDPKLFGFWARCVREAEHLSQEALAEAAGITVRTVQRFEAGAGVQIGSRRSLAKALGYDDQDIFDDPKFAATVLGFIDDLKASSKNRSTTNIPTRCVSRRNSSAVARKPSDSHRASTRLCSTSVPTSTARPRDRRYVRRLCAWRRRAR